MKSCRTPESLLTQLTLHVALAVYDAIQTDSLVPRRELTPPTYVPAGLGSTLPLHTRVSAPEAPRLDSLGYAMVRHAVQARPHLEAQLDRGVAYLDSLPPARRQRAPGHCDWYRVRLPGLALRMGGETYSVEQQSVDLDARHGPLEAALRTVWLAPCPVTRARGGYQRQGVAADQWAAWLALAQALLARVELGVTRDAYCAVGPITAIQAA